MTGAEAAARVGRIVERHWPTLLVLAACGGIALGSSGTVGGRLAPWGTALLAVALAAFVLTATIDTGPARLAFAAAALGVSGLWWGATREAALDRSVLAGRLEQAAQARVVVTGPARRTRFAIRLPGEVTRFAGTALREKVQLELPPGRAPPQGTVIELLARPVAPRGPETGFDEREWLARRGVHVVLRGQGWRVVGRRGGIGGVADRLREHVSTTLASGTSGEQRALLLGVVLGADEGIDEGLRDDFRASGLAHLLAVSGQNVAFLVVGTVALLFVLGVPRLVGEAAAIGTVAAYVLAVGWQPSVVRAGVAGILASLAWLAARPRDRWHAMAIGALVLLVWQPSSYLEPGFQLSFAAVAAIFVAHPRLVAVAAGYPVPRGIAVAASLALSAGFATAPIVWLHFGALPLWTIPANVLAEPAVPPLLWLSFAATAVQPVLPSAAVALAWLAGWCAAWIGVCARLFAGLPFARVHSPVVLLVVVLVAAVVIVLARLPSRRRGEAALMLVAAAAVVAAGWWSLRPSPSWSSPQGLRVTFLDVGQGDSTLLEVHEGAVLVDEGPPEAHVDRQLRDLGVASLAAIVLTHPQRDHVGGAADVVRRIRVGELLDPGLTSPSSDHDAALAAARSRNVPVEVVRTGDSFRLGRLRLRVLWPDRPGAPSEDPNQRAVVLLVSFGETDVLLTADAESDVTGRLPLRPVEILKVAHHGSVDAGLARELLTLRPRLAVISVGRHNRYGHPRAETIAALAASPGLSVLRTDENGRVVVESDGRTMSVRAERG